MIVCIAEKPSVARDIARILKAVHDRQGYYEGNGYAVTWTYGHLCTLKEPEDYNPAWKRWALADLPLLPPGNFGIKLKEGEHIQRQFTVIKELLSQATEVINCGDAGQEGELIQRWVLQLAGCRCPIKRLWISSMTDEAITEGFTKLRSEEQLRPLFYAGLARSTGDWLLGINASRLYTLRYGKPRQILSIGRVQTPTLALIVRRQQEIDQFVPVTSYPIATVYREIRFKSEEEATTNQTEAEAIVEQLATLPFEVKEVEKKRTREYPPKLFDLTALQVEANRKLGFSAEQTLATIQTLYERKLTSYPRVDTTYLPEDQYSKIPLILKQLAKVPEYSSSSETLLSKPIPKSKKVFNNSKITDHHAIIPTGVLPPALNAQEQALYEMIVWRFLAVFYPPAEIDVTTVKGVVGSHPFKAIGRIMHKLGWKELFQTEENEPSTDSTEAETPTMPPFREGEQGPHTPEVYTSTSQPPKPYTEATLLRAMETAGKMVEEEELREYLKENGIGRPSTRAAIIETLFKRDYITREGKSLRPTETGTDLIETIKNPLLMSAELTGVWEKKLRQIEKQEYDVYDFMNELKLMVHQLVKEVLSPQQPTEKETAN